MAARPNQAAALAAALEKGGEPEPLYLVAGDLVLAEPAARRIAEAAAGARGCEVVEHRRPVSLAPILQDLRTLALFSSGKVLLVVDSAVLADRAAAASLVDDAAEALPFQAGEELSSRQRQAASRLLQALHLFDVPADRGEPHEALSGLPDWALQGGSPKGGGSKRSRGKKQVAELRKGLEELLAAARASDLVGWADGDAAELAQVARGGLPKGHTLVLAERAAAAEHPVVAGLKQRGAFAELAHVESTRGGGWEGLDAVAAQLREETGVGIARDAQAELARRTLRGGSGWGANKAALADSTARFAAEYRKLATMAGSGAGISKAMVADVVADRGEQDAFGVLNAVGDGRAPEAVAKLRRLLTTAEDPMAARLTFFALLAGFCRQLAAVRGMMQVARVRPGERSYPRFRDRVAPVLQAELPYGAKNPLAAVKAYPLHRAYLAAGRLGERQANELPWRVLETEMLIKGESTEADAALTDLVVRVATG